VKLLPLTVKGWASSSAGTGLGETLAMLGGKRGSVLIDTSACASSIEFESSDEEFAEAVFTPLEERRPIEELTEVVPPAAEAPRSTITLAVNSPGGYV
jgi:hypothetical protein